MPGPTLTPQQLNEYIQSKVQAAGLSRDEFQLLVNNATGKSTSPQDQQRLQRSLGMDSNQYAMFVNMMSAQFDQTQFQSPERLRFLQTSFDALNGSTQDARGAATAETDIRNNITGNIQKFIDSMGIADPEISGMLQKRAQAQGSTAAGSAGMGGFGGGGLSQLGQESINAGLDAQYKLQRQGLALQGQGLLNQRDLGLGQLEQGYAKMQQDRDISKWAGDQNQAQAIGAGIGGAVGALGFIGGPALGAATMGAGSSLGAGFAGAAGPQSPTYSGGTSIGANRGSRGTPSLNGY